LGVNGENIGRCGVIVSDINNADVPFLIGVEVNSFHKILRTCGYSCNGCRCSIPTVKFDIYSIVSSGQSTVGIIVFGSITANIINIQIPVLSSAVGKINMRSIRLSNM
jgi:hypothetical protein